MCRLENTECRQNELPFKKAKLAEDKLVRQTNLYKFQITNKLPVKIKP